MGITYEPSVGEQLGPAIDQFAKGLSKALQPNRDFQIAMQKAIGGNPALGQQLADLEYNAPGTLANLGFGDLGKVVAAMPESEQSQLMRTSRGEILAGDKQKIALTNAEQGLDLETITGMTHWFKDPKNAALVPDVLRRKLGLPTIDQGRMQKVEADVGESEAPEKVAQAKARKAALDAAIERYPELKDIDYFETARRAVNKGDPKASSLLSAALTLPGTKELAQDALRDVEQAKRESDADFRMATISGRGESRQLDSQAYGLYKASGRVGTFAAWKTVLSDPQKIEDAQAKKPGDRTKEEKDLVAADQSNTQAQQRMKMNDVAKTNSTVSASDIGIRKEESNPNGPDLGIVNSHLANLNSTFSAQGRKITAKFGLRPNVGNAEANHWGVVGGLGNDGTGLYYVDEAGKRIKDSEAFTDPKSVSLSSDAIDFLSTWHSSSEKDRAGVADRLAKSNPSLYNEVKDSLGVKKP